MSIEIPKEIQEVVQKLNRAGYQAYPVGGCVRDVLRGVKPQDWDITTDAKPEEIQEIFPKSFYENKFGTVTVAAETEDPTLREVEITPFRTEAKYTDKRHPDEIRFAQKLEDDLGRRDFTINALALSGLSRVVSRGVEGMAFGIPQKQKSKKAKKQENIEIIDLFEGQKDLESNIVRTVGNPDERFNEDALRMMRAIRFATNLKFEVEKETFDSIQRNARLLDYISKERARDELVKIVMSEDARKGVDLLRESGLLQYVVPELLECYGVTQNKHHIYDVYEHCVRALDFAAKKSFDSTVRFASLFHDIGKPRVKKGEGPDATFYSHEVVGAKMTEDILRRLHFPGKDVGTISKLVRYHLFYYNVGEVGENSVRRLVRKVSVEDMEKLLEVRMADRIGSGVPKAEPYKLRHLKYVIDKISKDPISVKMLKVGGNDVMRILNIEPGPKVGQVLDILLGEVLDSPDYNRVDLLSHRVEELGKMRKEDLSKTAESSRKIREQIETKQDQMTKKKYWVV